MAQLWLPISFAPNDATGHPRQSLHQRNSRALSQVVTHNTGSIRRAVNRLTNSKSNSVRTPDPARMPSETTWLGFVVANVRLPLLIMLGAVCSGFYWLLVSMWQTYCSRKHRAGVANCPYEPRWERAEAGSCDSF